MSRPRTARLNVLSLEDRTVPAVLDLTSVGAVQAANGALFAQGAPVAAGSFNSFVSLRSNGVEQGYNTDARPLQFDEANSKNATHALKLSDVPMVTVGQTAYYQFVLNVHEQRIHPLLSLDELRVYTASTNALSGYNAKTHQLGGQAPVYDLDGSGNSWVKLNANLNLNRGAGDMYFYLPVSSFQLSGPTAYVYLYSKLGGHNAADGGGEQWGVLPVTKATGSISGTLFNDANQNGVLDAGETGLAGAAVFIDANGNGILDANETYVVSDANGNYTFTGLAANATYHVRVLTQGTGSNNSGASPGNSPVVSVTTALPDVTLTSNDLNALGLLIGGVTTSQPSGSGTPPPGPAPHV
jgi:hypothetical protein